MISSFVFFFKQKTAYEIGLGIPAEPLFRSSAILNFLDESPERKTSFIEISRGGKLPYKTGSDRKSGSAGMPRPSSYAVFCLTKKNNNVSRHPHPPDVTLRQLEMLQKVHSTLSF